MNDKEVAEMNVKILQEGIRATRHQISRIEDSLANGVRFGWFFKRARTEQLTRKYQYALHHLRELEYRLQIERNRCK